MSDLHDPAFRNLITCSWCKQDSARFPGAQIYIEWSDASTTEGDGCVGEMFCSRICMARWACAWAGLKPPAIEP
jgi:hypothetical protein